MVGQQRKFSGHTIPCFMEPMFTNSHHWTSSWVHFTLWHYFSNFDCLSIYVSAARKSELCPRIIKSAVHKDGYEGLEQSNASLFQGEKCRNA
jgi:hypothetical protein